MSFKIIFTVLKKILWSFFGEKIIAKLVWMFLEYAARQSTNSMDDQAVKMAKSAYYGVKTH